MKCAPGEEISKAEIKGKPRPMAWTGFPLHQEVVKWPSVAERLEA